MTSPPTPPADDTPRHPRANVLRITSRPAGDDTGIVHVPPADDEAWEGTEIDVRRTVL